jgi:23S rRNA (pseudouridine1915-N3)-methyltransferase
MLRVRLIAVGKLKEAFWADACREYQKRLAALCRLEIVELAEEPERPDALAREAVRIEDRLPKEGYLAALCIEGRELSSAQLAAQLAELQNRGVSQLTLLIGSSNGLDERLKARADLRLSMSPMTFPHHLARVMVLEQLYRALSINAGSKYHK